MSNLMDVAPLLERAEPWNAAERVARSNQTTHIKFQFLQRIAQGISEIASPKTACSQGCNYCCYQSVSISEIEAKAISSFLKRSYTLPQETSVYDDREKYMGVPCCFLQEGKCAVYQERPIICRTHINMSNHNEICKINPSSSHEVPYLNTSFLHYPIAKICGNTFHDIRDWFPKE